MRQMIDRRPGCSILRSMREIMMATLLLAGCQASEASTAKQLEAQDEIVQRSGTDAEKCASRRRVRDAWLSASDEHRYEYWSALADIECNTS